MRTGRARSPRRLAQMSALSLVLITSPATAQSPITFQDIATSPASGLASYQRTPSTRHTAMLQFLLASVSQPITMADILPTPMRSRGMPGVALLDVDRDGDLDMYVTNGPGTPNSLFLNQLAQTGQLTFVDVATQAGVAVTEQDSTGVCFGDINNNGYLDLMVLGHDSPPRLFQNNGDGTFNDISISAGIHQGVSAASCVMGDVNGDGLLDIFIARGYSLNTLVECFTDPFSADIKPNDLFINKGDSSFRNASLTSGIRDLTPSGHPANINTMTWAAALVDIDNDGDLDLVQADDQCNYPMASAGGFDRGYVQLFRNNGRGQFTNITANSPGLARASEWMGVSFADFNGDGFLDMFVTSFGDWGKQFVGAPFPLGSETSRWFLNDGQGGFVDPGVGSLVYTPFGWGTSAEDFDNDGATDIAFFGGLDMVMFVDKSNAGTVLFNDGDANFRYEPAALGERHRRRNDAGVAAGDLNGDGFVDLITVSNFNVPEPLPLLSYADLGLDHGTPFDPAYQAPVMAPNEQGSFSWTGVLFPNGTLSVELNQGESGNASVAVELLGTKGIVAGGRSVRDGIGATVKFTPLNGRVAMKPVLGGSSYASQDSLTAHFGMGSARKGDIEVRWTSGARTRLDNVKAGERVLIPEIPCRFDVPSVSHQAYTQCVRLSLNALKDGGYLTNREANQLQNSAMRAYAEHQP